MADFLTAISTQATALAGDAADVAGYALVIGAVVYGVTLVWRLFKRIK